MSAAASPPAAATFRMRTMLIVLGAGLLAAIAFAVLLTFAPELRGAEDDGAHALSRSAVGYAGLVRLLKQTGTPVGVLRRPPSLNAPAGLLVLTPPLGADAGATRTAASYRGSVLIVAPKWATASSSRHPGWVTVEGLIPTADAAGALARPEIPDLERADGASTVVLRPGPGVTGLADAYVFGRVDRLQARASGAGSPLLQTAGGDALLVGVGARQMVLTDPDLLNNHGVADPLTARSAVALIRRLRPGDAPVLFDVTLNGFTRPRNLMQTALTPPFFAATLSALIAFALLGWRALVRFGPTARPERAVALGKRALVDNAAGLIRLTRREARMAPRYAAATRAAAARAVGAPRALAPEAIDAYLDRLGDPSGRTRPFTILVEAARASDRSVEALMRSARDLFRWRAEITRGRR